jgi:hypothetical protein
MVLMRVLVVEGELPGILCAGVAIGNATDSSYAVEQGVQRVVWWRLCA